MRVPFGWLLPAVALGAAGIAVWTSADLSVALPATIAAVAAASLLLFEVALGRRRAAPTAAGTGPAPHRVGVRASFGAGAFGRQEIVVELDRAERGLRNPGLPTRTLEEMDRIARLRPPEFRQYVRERIEYLERDA
jgi:hypothetical protein